MSALAVWAVGTLVLLVAAIVAGQVQRVRLTPDWQLLGGSGIQLLANICAVIPILTTSYSCQAAAPFVVQSASPNPFTHIPHSGDDCLHGHAARLTSLSLLLGKASPLW